MNKNIFEPIQIERVTLQEQDYKLDSTHYLTIISIQEGRGSSLYEEQEVPFKKGKLFVVPQHSIYQFKGKCTLLIIRCPKTFINQLRNEADRIETCDNLTKLSYIHQNYHTKAGCVFRDANDETFAERLLQVIQYEYNTHNKDYLIIRQSVSILLNLISRNLIKSEVSQFNENKEARDIMKVIAYIQENITSRDNLCLDAIAGYFKFSKSYFGEYFKKQVGVSLQDYILDYRLKLVETRLQYSSKRIKEIAYELNFNDESHLTKLFKKRKGITPSQYRKETTQSVK